MCGSKTLNPGSDGVCKPFHYGITLGLSSGWVKCLSVCLERYYWGRTRTWSFCSRPSSGWTVGGWRVCLKCFVEGPLSLFVREHQFLNQRAYSLKRWGWGCWTPKQNIWNCTASGCRAWDLTPFQGWDLGNQLLLGILKSEIFLSVNTTPPNIRLWNI